MQQFITIDQARLKQINDQFGLMNQELSILADGTHTKQEAAVRLQRISKTFGFKPEVVGHMMAELQEAPDVKTFAERALLRGQSTQEKLNQIYGVPHQYDTGQVTIPAAVSQMRGPRATGLPIQQQIPPTASVYDSENRPTMQGPTPAVTPPGTVSGPLPIQQVPTTRIIRGDTGVTPEGVPPNQVVQNRYPMPSGPAVGQSPLFSEGLKEYTADQRLASDKSIAIKPLVEALPLIQRKDFLSGPGTDAFTRGVAALKTWGLLDIAENSDPTAIRQEVNKKLAQYISNSPIGQRSDAQQSLKEASSPSAKVQIQPALIRLVKDAVALERISIAMPNAFQGKDYENYIKHKGRFPNSVDQKALILDLEAENGKKIVDEMAAKLKKNPKDKAALKFFETLDMADKARIYN